MSRFKVLIVPSSDEEGHYEDVSTFTEAVKVFEKGKYSSAKIYEFGTRSQMHCFIEGYKAGVGYLGSGFYFKNC